MSLERDLPNHPVILIRKLSNGHDFYCGSSHINHVTPASPDKVEFCFIQLRHFYFRQSYDEINGCIDLGNLSTSEFSFTVDGHQTKIGTGDVQRLSEGEQEATLGAGLDFSIVVASKSRSTSSSPALTGISEIQHSEHIKVGLTETNQQSEPWMKTRTE